VAHQIDASGGEGTLNSLGLETHDTQLIPFAE
jgi:hypothetical protein